MLRATTIRFAAFAAMLMPAVCYGQLMTCAAIRHAPFSDAQIAEKVCDAFGRHPRLGDKLIGCTTSADSGEIDLYGTSLTAQDLYDFCTSIEAMPSADGNITITARDGKGVPGAVLRCTVDMEFRRTPIDKPR